MVGGSAESPAGTTDFHGSGAVADPEDLDGDVEKFTAFMQFLAPPGRKLPITPMAQQGGQIFDAIRCTACHVPSMMTGPNSVASLNRQQVPLFSDLLLHHMGPQLADGIQQEQAKGDQFKTAPLWGLYRRSFFLHDGRAGTIEDAIMNHAGEATAARNSYMQLHPPDRKALLSFLNTL